MMSTNTTKDKNSLIQDVYSDVLQPAAKQTGKLLEKLPRAINAALSELDIWISKRENNIDKTKKLLEHELENQNPEKIVSPDPYVAVPAIQAISYSIDSDELRSMYAKLLSKSMHVDYQQQVHPSFVDIIKNMSPLDCLVFKTIMEDETKNVFPFYEVQEHNQNSFTVRLSILTYLDISRPSQIEISITNLIRLGLFSIPEGQYITNKYEYEKINLSKHFAIIKDEIDKYSAPNSTVKYGKKMLRLTRFARSFYEICVKSID